MVDLPDGYSVRVATTADIATLAEHRIAMFTDMGTPLDAERVRSAFTSWLRMHLPAGTYQGWLVDAPDRTVAAGAGVTVLTWPPGPREFSGRLPMVYNVYTAPAHRRRGLARGLMETIHLWCRAEGFSVIGLAASADGRHVYETLGYEPSRQPYMFLAL